MSPWKTAYVREYHLDLLHDPVWDWPEHQQVAEDLDRMSRPKDQSQDEPAIPTAIQHRSIGWIGYQLTVRELRGWLNPLPDDATVTIWVAPRESEQDREYGIEAAWEVP